MGSEKHNFFLRLVQFEAWTFDYYGTYHLAMTDRLADQMRHQAILKTDVLVMCA